jgi:hypothetical protein
MQLDLERRLRRRRGCWGEGSFEDISFLIPISSYIDQKVAMEVTKKELLLAIESNQDEETLSYLLAWIKFRNSHENFGLSPEMSERIALGRIQKEEGKTIPHKIAMEQMQAWLNGK